MSSAVTGLLCLLAFAPLSLRAQTVPNKDSIVTTISSKLSQKYIQDVGNRSAEYQAKMEQCTEKYISKLNAQELVLQQQLNKVNPAEADRIFNGSQQVYDKIQNDVKNNSENILKGMGKYESGIDSAITSYKISPTEWKPVRQTRIEYVSGAHGNVEGPGIGRSI
jgi:hypothetical protein